MNDAWKVEHDCVGNLVVSAGGKIIAEIEADAEQYAPLMAAAPDLKAALLDVLPTLEMLLREAENLGAYGPWMDEAWRKVEQARAAIKKANGETC